MNGFLHLGLKVLNAHAQPVKSQAAQAFEVATFGHSRIDLDSNLGVGGKGESFAGVAEKIFHLRGSEIGWRASAPVKLSDGPFAGHSRANVTDFFLERVQVGNRYTFVFLNGDIAGAEQAEAFAEGKMHVKRNGCRG